MEHRALRLIAFAAALVAAGCERDEGPAEDAARQVDTSALPGVYSGTFPCANCPGIEVRLWLRSDGVFFMRQDYLADESQPADRAHSLGRWRWDAAASLLVLGGRGPERRFDYMNGERLELRTLSDLEHALDREAAPLPFTDRIQIEGELRSGAEPSTFRECVTTATFEIREDAQAKSLRRRHRAVSAPGEPALVVVEAHFDYPDPAVPEQATLAVDGLLTIKPKTTCPG